MKFFRALFILICVFVAFNAHAQSSEELKRRRDNLTQELEKLNQDYQQTASSKKVTLKQLNILKAQITLHEQKIGTINSEVRNLDNQISESNNSVNSLRAQLDQLKKEYAAMVLFAYRNQSAYNKLMFIFAAKDFNQAYKRLKYLQQFGTYRERQAKYIQGTEQDLHVKINELDKNKKEKSNLLVNQVKEKETLGQEQNEQAKVVVDLSKHEKELKGQQKDVKKKIAITNRQIQITIQREIAEAKRKAEEEARAAAKAAEKLAAEKAKAENKEPPAPVKRAAAKAQSNSQLLNATPEAAKMSNDFLGNRGRLPWPVGKGFITQGFGIYYDQGIKSSSTGVDIKTDNNAAVRAVFAGEVSNVLPVIGTYLVIIRHGEYFTAYSNLRSVSVAKGQKVSTKQNIGTVATDPTTGETVVHFELYKGLNAVNPSSWLAPN